MTDRAELDSTIRSWLKRVPLSAIVILLEAVRDEIGARAVAKLSPTGSRDEAEFLRTWVATQWARNKTRQAS